MIVYNATAGVNADDNGGDMATMTWLVIEWQHCKRIRKLKYTKGEDAGADAGTMLVVMTMPLVVMAY